MMIAGTDDIPSSLVSAAVTARAQPLLTPRVLESIERSAAAIGLEKNDLTELLLMGALADQARRLGPLHSEVDGRSADDAVISCRVLQAFETGNYVAVPRIERNGTRVFDHVPPATAPLDIRTANVLAFRMAHRQDVADDQSPNPGGYPRPGLGMDLSMTASEVWERSRGYWRVRPDADYILPTRLGYAPYLFKTAAWRTASDATNPSDRSARYWAQKGWLVNATGHTLVAMDGSGIADATELDLQIAAQLPSPFIRFPPNVRNPAVWIGRSS